MIMRRSDIVGGIVTESKNMVVRWMCSGRNYSHGKLLERTTRRHICIFISLKTIKILMGRGILSSFILEAVDIGVGRCYGPDR